MTDPQRLPRMSITSIPVVDDINRVVESGMCIGCGGCALAIGGDMSLNDYGEYRPTDAVLRGSAPHAERCPFLAPELNEDHLADVFLPETPRRSAELGKYLDLFAAHVEEDNWRRDGSSGGLGSWIPAELLKRDEIDAVIHVKPAARSAREDPFFRYAISRNLDEIAAGAHSHYHVAEISQVLRTVRETPGRYLFVGVPCMVKALRRAQLKEPVLRERVRFTMALICGHFKSVHWALSLGWAAGVAPGEIEQITFRVKNAGIPAKSYYFGVRGREDTVAKVVDSAGIVGGKFNLGAMMPEACNYCDDVVGETADLTIGDAWLPRYIFDWRGKNMVISRSEKLSAILREAARETRVALEAMSHEEAVGAQAGGFRQRREGLAYRIKKYGKANRWIPEKRTFTPVRTPGVIRRVIYDLREECASRSRHTFREALDRGDLAHYTRAMSPLFLRLRRLEILVSLVRIARTRIRAIMPRLRS